LEQRHKYTGQLRLSQTEPTRLDWWHKPKIICAVGVVQDNNLRQVVARIENICCDLGFNPSPYHYTPHITLLRKAKQFPVQLEGLNITLPMTIAPQAIVLYHSHSGLDGVQYDVLKSWPLTD